MAKHMVIGLEEEVARLEEELTSEGVSLNMFNPTEVGHLVALFYHLQKDRVALQLYARDAEVSPLLLRLIEDLNRLEKATIKAAANILKRNKTYEWLRGIKGVGPILAASLIGTLPPEKFPSPAALWSYVGMTPDKGPSGTGPDDIRFKYSRQGKTLAYKLAVSQVMLNGDYRPWYDRRKEYEWRKNLSGEYADQATKRNYGNDTNAKLFASGKLDPEKVARWLAGEIEDIKECVAENGKGVPMLIPAHIDARARRWLAKLMLDHYWQVDYYYRTGEVWVPYAIAHKGHVDRIDPVQAPWLIKPVNFAPGK